MPHRLAFAFTIAFLLASSPHCLSQPLTYKQLCSIERKGTTFDELQAMVGKDSLYLLTTSTAGMGEFRCYIAVVHPSPEWPAIFFAEPATLYAAFVIFNGKIFSWTLTHSLSTFQIVITN